MSSSDKIIETEWTLVFYSVGGWIAKKGKKMMTRCIDKESTLHSIWVSEGRDENDFYKVNKKGAVYIRRRING